MRSGPPMIRRDADRRITAGGIAVSAVFVGLAVGSVLLPASDRHGSWLPLHLALPGAATVAIGSVLPFFIAALAAARPGPPAARVATIALLASGALAVSIGITGGAGGLAAAGGVAFVAGIVGLGWLLVRILGGALGSRRGLLPRAYGAALANVAVGASLATLYAAGWPPVLEAWGRLKPAHAWLNLFGFVGLVIAATLTRLYPTVLGTRIAVRRSTRAALLGLSGGPTTIAVGYLLDLDAVARLGAVLTIGGAAALIGFLVETHRIRGHWTTGDPWHRFASWSLAAGVAWYAVGVAVAAGRVIVLGAAPTGWGVELVAVPLAVGFVLQVLVGSWTHLLPAVGPGDQRLHARQRSVLATAADARLAAFDAGAVLMAVGVPSGATPIVVAGATLVGGALLAALALLARAVTLRPEAPPEAPPTRDSQPEPPLEPPRRVREHRP